MCGITGLFYFNSPDRVDDNTLTAMRETMRHRGPDGGANWLSADGRVGLGHRRLSIIDLAGAAAQPMPNEDESIWLTFNGEIYNHLKLRRELIAAGHRFRTDHSDTEVIVHGYEEWELEGLLHRLEGMFALGLWDANRQTLSLVRDRVGIKPLYFSLQNDLLLFGSEIKAILAHPDVTRDIDPVAMVHYLSFMTTPAPLTMFKHIYKLPAGTYLQVRAGGHFEAKRYWDAGPGRGIDSAEINGLSDTAMEQYYIDRIRRCLTEAVEKRMMSDVPFGVFLSGGIDSSTNVALMSRFMERPVDTFTVGFKDYQHLNELDYANLIAKEFQTNHHQILIDERDMMGYLESLVHSQDEPIADWVCIPLYFVSKLAYDHGLKVIQVGEGSDEQFCGYGHYLQAMERYRKYWRPFKTYLPVLAQQGIAGAALAAARFGPRRAQVAADIIDRAAKDRELFWSGAMVFWDVLKAQLLNGHVIQAQPLPQVLLDTGLLPPAYQQPDSFNVIQSFIDPFDRQHPGQDFLTRLIYNEFKLRLPELLLMRVDKITMSTSLEARVPFLDHKMVELTMDIPMRWKVRNGQSKYLLKKAVEGWIPHQIIHRPKMGFGAPMNEWLRGDFGQYVRQNLFASRLMNYGYFNLDYIHRLIDEHRCCRRDNSAYIWTLFNLSAWYDYWIDS